jgi:hypothetical protein
MGRTIASALAAVKLLCTVESRATGCTQRGLAAYQHFGFIGVVYQSCSLIGV